MLRYRSHVEVLQGILTMGTFGSRLREERVRRKLSQTALAEIGGIQVNAQGHYESGFRLPKIDYLFAMAGIMDVGYLLTGERSSLRLSELSAPEFAILSTFRKMSVKDKACVGELFTILAGHIN